MDRLDEIRQRTEAGGPIRRIEMKYLLSEVDRLNALHKREIIITGEYAQRVIDLTARAEAAEAERDAAVEDLKTMALAMRESDELEVGCCFACKFDASNNDNMEPWNECPGFNTDNCFEWRGLQDGKGAAK